ncbi:hypothetical protein [Legionella sp. 227]|uniref:hypothetical protein n=1 Tax=Legionella sp. 227 TaxID=3367288 RepID=UPI00370D0CE5
MQNISDIKSLLALSGKPDSIPEDLMAFFLYLKKRLKKSRDKFNAFAMSYDEMDCLAGIIEQMIECCVKDLRFEIAFSKWDGSAQLNHWSFLEFNFKGTETPPGLDILICDPLGFKQSLVLTNLLSSKMKFGSLSKLCTLMIYIPIDTLQVKGRTCAYFVTDNVSMLANQDKYNPVYDYMRSHQHESKIDEAMRILAQFRESLTNCYTEEELNEIYDFKLVASALPVRLLRTKHSVPELEKEVRDSENLKDEIVNYKGETAWHSISKNLFFVKDRGGEEEYRNMRINKKMEKLKGIVSELSSSCLEEEIQSFYKAMHEHRLFGLKQFIIQNIKTADKPFLTLR